MTTTTTIRAALEAEKPAAAEEFERYIREYWTGFVAEFGDDTFELSKWSYNFTSKGEYFRQRRRVVYPFTREHVVDGVKREFLCDDWLAKAAIEYANRTIDQMIAKLEGKTGDLVGVEVVRIVAGALEVILQGSRGGDSVKIEQRRIMNTSPRGNMFNQYPALIYVNGKKTSEAAYKRSAA